LYEAIFSRGDQLDCIGGDFRPGCAQSQYRESASVSRHSGERDIGQIGVSGKYIPKFRKLTARP
jgi:hypothetical protein